MPAYERGRQWSNRRWGLLIAAGAIGMAGYFGPWVPHRTAGLIVTGLDLAEYVKFLPEVMSGQIALARESFYAPLTAGSLIAILLVSRAALAPLLRASLLATAVALALAQLPPAWSPDLLRLPEYRIQVIAIGLCLSAIPLIVLLRYMHDRVILACMSLLGLVAALWPAHGFLQVRPAVAAVYGALPPLGWGFWACLVGFAGLAFVGTAFALARQPARRHS